MRLGGDRSSLERRSVYRFGFDTSFEGTSISVAPLSDIMGSPSETWALAGGRLKYGEAVLEEPYRGEKKAGVSLLCMKPDFLPP